jgi:2-polyprenyl-3-methyl-5-hydroxy-6-metoxy-1,4-benzoquinol methylase
MEERMSAEHVHEQNEKTRAAWNTNAEFWDERMAEGNDFFKMLVWPSTERLLGTVAGRRILDAACGNGVSSRKLAANGAHVVAFDFAEGPVPVRTGSPARGCSTDLLPERQQVGLGCSCSRSP